eukprot:jgi/Botrbrau1/14058/Bobra.182_3s0005.1
MYISPYTGIPMLACLSMQISLSRYLSRMWMSFENRYLSGMTMPLTRDILVQISLWDDHVVDKRYPCADISLG